MGANQTHIADTDALRSRFRGCLMGVAIGDAFGAPFEGVPEVSERAWRDIVDGDERLRFTDDTHMTFGVIESLLGQGGFNGEDMARIFVRDYNAEPWRGYGAGPPQVFAMLEAGARWDKAGKRLFGGRGSFGNGAAMRAAPIGLRYFTDVPRAVDVARQSALITHAHDLGMEGAAAQACAVAVAVTTRPPLDPDRFIDQVVDHLRNQEMKQALGRVRALLAGAEPHTIARELGNGIEAVEAVPTALAAFLCNVDSFPDAVAFAVAIGGDTDTIASMAGALSGAYLGERAMPPAWRDRAEGAPSMARLANMLFDHALGKLDGNG